MTRADMQKAIVRNLHLWSRWRTMVNDALIKGDMFQEQVFGKKSFIPDLDEIINSRTPYDNANDLHVSDPMSLMTYAPHNDSNLPPMAYLCYGMPRVRINVTNQNSKQQNNEYNIEDEVDDIYAGYPFVQGIRS